MFVLIKPLGLLLDALMLFYQNYRMNAAGILKIINRLIEN